MRSKARIADQVDRETHFTLEDLIERSELSWRDSLFKKLNVQNEIPIKKAIQISKKAMIEIIRNNQFYNQVLNFQWKGGDKMATPEELIELKENAAEKFKVMMVEFLNKQWDTGDISSSINFGLALKDAMAAVDEGFEDEMGMNIAADGFSRLLLEKKPPYPTMD